MKTAIAVAACLLAGLLLSGAAAARELQSIAVTVRAGDSIYDICNIYLADFRQWREVAKYNGLKNPDRIYPGQKLKIPVMLLQGTTSPGRITLATGEVMYRSRGLPQWMPVGKNRRVYPGDTIRTGKMSAAEIRFDDGHVILLRQKTTLTLRTSRRLSRFQQLVEFFLEVGRAVLRAPHATGGASQYEIQTPSAVAASRGTYFRTSVDRAENMRCEVLSGEVLVSANEKEVQVHPLQGTVVSKNHPPHVPVRLLSPPTIVKFQPLYRSLPLRLKFENVPLAARYRVELAREDDFRELLRDKTSVAGAELLIRDLDDGIYYLRARSIDKLGLEGPSSAALRLTLRANPLAPYVQRPESNARIHGSAVTFQWTRVADARSYQLQVAGDAAFHHLIVDRDHIRTLTYQLDRLTPRTYYFRIRSIARDGYRGEWGRVLRFAMLPLPARPTGGDTKIGKKNVMIQWPAMGTGFRYHVQISKDRAFGALLLDKKTQKTAFSFTRPKDAGTYYIRISSIDPAGVEGRFSKPQSFEVKAPYGRWIPGLLIAILIAIGL